MRITEVGWRNGVGALVVEDTGPPDWRPVVAGTHPVRGVVGKVAVKDPVAGVVGAKLDIEKVTGIDGLGCLPGLLHRGLEVRMVGQRAGMSGDKRGIGEVAPDLIGCGLLIPATPSSALG